MHHTLNILLIYTLKVRGDGRWSNVEKWMDAFETMPSYLATKSDYYTHVMDIPPQ